MTASSDRFVADVSKWEAVLGKRLNRFYQNIVFEAADQGVVTPGRWGPGTPIDTSFARRSWRVGIGAPVDGPSHNTVKAGGELPPETDFSVLAQLTVKDPAYLTSNAEYMGSLENGHSQQAPTGMIRTTLSQAQQIVDYVGGRMTGNKS